MELSNVIIKQGVDQNNQTEETRFDFGDHGERSGARQGDTSRRVRDDVSTSLASLSRFRSELGRIETRIVEWLISHSIQFMRGGLGIVFLWFGALKFIPGLSPAQAIAVQTMHVLTFGLVPPEVSLVALAILECTIGIGFLMGRFMRVTLVLMGFQMAGTLTPLVLFPGTAFTVIPYGLTLEGQYIIKNLVLIGGGMVVAATVHGGYIIAAHATPLHEGSADTTATIPPSLSGETESRQE